MTFPGQTGHKRKSEEQATVLQPDWWAGFRERQTRASNLPRHMQITIVVLSQEDSELYQRLKSRNGKQRLMSQAVRLVHEAGKQETAIGQTGRNAAQVSYDTRISDTVFW